MSRTGERAQTRPGTRVATTPQRLQLVAGASPPKLLTQVRDALRVRHMRLRTEEAYVGWVKRFILFHNKRHPATMGGSEVAAFLNALAVQHHVSASTQNQALAAVLFLYRQALSRGCARFVVVLDSPFVRPVYGAADDHRDAGAV